jgi:lipopolysaccharide export system protein LptA
VKAVTILVLAAAAALSGRPAAAEEGAGRSVASNTASRARGETVITSERLEYDYKESVVLFDENVKVQDPQFTLNADRVLVYLEGTNEVRQVRALGNVRVVSGERSASCKQAVYTRASGQIVMTGEAVLQRQNDQIWGKQITIWVNDQRMECVAPRMVIQPATLKGGRVLP